MSSKVAPFREFMQETLKSQYQVKFRRQNSGMYFQFFMYYLTSPTRAGSPQQLMPITVGPHYLTHPVKSSLTTSHGGPNYYIVNVKFYI